MLSKWQYEVKESDIPLRSNDLCIMGNDRWELISYTHQDRGNRMKHVYVFKRVKLEN